MPTKHDQREKAVRHLIEAAKRAQAVRKAAKAVIEGEVEEGEEE